MTLPTVDTHIDPVVAVCSAFGKTLPQVNDDKYNSSVWNCSASGVPVTNPCGGDIPAWPGIICDENSLITSISLSNVGLSGM